MAKMRFGLLLICLIAFAGPVLVYPGVEVPLLRLGRAILAEPALDASPRHKECQRENNQERRGSTRWRFHIRLPVRFDASLSAC